MTLPCIKCGKALGRALPDGLDGNQPSDGCCFWTDGHYGSTVFDLMDGSRLEINLCDPCLEDAIQKGTAAPPQERSR